MFILNQVKYKTIIDMPYLEIPSGITCLIGSSGAGKTTLLKLLNRLYSPSAGTILYDGCDIVTIDSVELRKKVIMLSQTAVIYEGTIADNLQMGLRLRKLPDASDDKLQAVLQLVSLHKALYDRCDNLSGGEKQRLCLARVLLLDGSVYLLDEPSSALDKESEAILIDALATYVTKHHKSMIMVTHSLEAIAQLQAHKIRIAKGFSEVIQ